MKVGVHVENIEHESSSIDFKEMTKRKIANELGHYIVEHFDSIAELDRRPDTYRGDVVRYRYETNIVSQAKYEEIMRLLQIMGLDAKDRQDYVTLGHIIEVDHLLND